VWGGIGAAADRGIDRRAAARGIAPFTPEEGLALLESTMHLPLPHVGVFRVRWDDNVQAASTSPFLSQLRKGGAPAGSGEATPATGTAATLMDRLGDASPSRRREMLLAFVAEQVARVLAAPNAAAIDPRQPLNELGLDSLMAVELRNRLGRGLGLARSLPATLVFDHPTLEALSRFLEDTLDPESEASVTDSPPADAVVAIDDLSDEQIEHLFARRMQGN
jgi:aryl carrier-like protein